jgi:hypothetical protein
MRLHDSRSAERLAFAWHVFWAFVCLLCACNYVACSIAVWPFAGLFGEVGLVFKYAYWLSLTQIVFALFGFLWHVWGCNEHLKELRRMKP